MEEESDKVIIITTVNMKDYIQIGIEKGLISFNEDKSRIKYCYQGKERNS